MPIPCKNDVGTQVPSDMQALSIFQGLFDHLHLFDRNQPVQRQTFNCSCRPVWISLVGIGQQVEITNYFLRQ